MRRHLSLLLFIGLAWGKPLKIVSGYDESTNSFFCKDTSLSNISAFTFINSLKEVSSSKQIKNRKLRKRISKYSKACEKTIEMAVLYQEGRPHKDGRILEKDSYLINNVKYWYNFGGILCIIIVAPEFFELMSFFEIFSDDKNEEYNQYDSSDYEDYDEGWENYTKKWYRRLGKKTFLPGLAIISIGYIGQKIKIGQKKTYIKKSDIVHPIISKYFSPDELKEAVRIYNNLWLMQDKGGLE